MNLAQMTWYGTAIPAPIYKAIYKVNDLVSAFALGEDAKRYLVYSRVCTYSKYSTWPVFWRCAYSKCRVRRSA